MIYSSFLLFFLLSFRPSFSQNTSDQYQQCTQSSFSCDGNNTSAVIRYPFLAPNTPRYCGHPGYELTCTRAGHDTVLSIRIAGKLFAVTEPIDYYNQVLSIANIDLFEYCPRSLTNTTLISSGFTDSDLNFNLTYYLNCNHVSDAIPDIFPVDRHCNESVFGGYSYYGQQSEISDSEIMNCSSKLIVPVFQSTWDVISNGTTRDWNASTRGFAVTWTAGQGWCSRCLQSGGQCGYNSSGQQSHICYCPEVNSTPFLCAGPHAYSSSPIVFVVGYFVIGGLFIVAFLLSAGILRFFMRCIRRMRSRNDRSIKDFLKKHGPVAPKRYKYSEVKMMTKDFHEKLGNGGFGSVFKGTLVDGRVVAVKVLNNSKGNGEDFINEVASIGRTSHVNIVGLLGFCFKGSKRALIYEFMPNDSLEKYIYAKERKTTLGWEKLYQIAIGIARGLEYLHRDCNTRIVHFDIKPHNILLDEDFIPKISDFGLAKLCPPKGSILSMADARGTVGYIAPEVFSRNFGVVSSKSDVYSYGMMILEMTGGRKNLCATADKTSEIYFPHWIYDHLDRDGDLQYCGVTNEAEEEIARKMILVGLWCIQAWPENRPSMSGVVDMLQGSIKELAMPPKPRQSSPPRSMVRASTMSIS